MHLHAHTPYARALVAHESELLNAAEQAVDRPDELTEDEARPVMARLANALQVWDSCASQQEDAAEAKGQQTDAASIH